MALGTVTLSDNDLAGLDRLLSFYRRRPRGGCTTLDRITVTQKSGDAVKGQESFIDASCATYERKDLTRFRSLVGKLKPREE